MNKIFLLRPWLAGLTLVLATVSEAEEPFKERAAFLAHPRLHIVGLAYSRDGSRLATVAWDYSVKVWDVKDKACLQTFPFPVADYAYAVAGFQSRDDALLIAAQRTRGVKGWELWRCDARTGAQELLRANPGDERALALWPERATLVTAAEDPGNRAAPYALRFVGLDGQGDTFIRAEAPPRLLCASRDKKLVAYEVGKKEVRVAEVATGRVVVALQAHPEGCKSALLSPDNTELLTLTKDIQEIHAHIHFWDLTQARKRGAQLAPLGRLNQLADVTPDGRAVAGHSREIISFYDFRAGKFTATFRLRKAKFHSLRFAPDGKTFATGSEDGFVRIFETPSVEQAK